MRRLRRQENHMPCPQERARERYTRVRRVFRCRAQARPVEGNGSIGEVAVSRIWGK